MSVKIRLKRMGRRNRPSYRIVVADSRSPRDGRFVETLGHYDPLTDPATIKVDEDKVKKWLDEGAQPSETVKSILSRFGFLKKWHEVEVMERKKQETLKGKEQAAGTTPSKEGEKAKEE